MLTKKKTKKKNAAEWFDPSLLIINQLAPRKGRTDRRRFSYYVLFLSSIITVSKSVLRSNLELPSLRTRNRMARAGGWHRESALTRKSGSPAVGVAHARPGQMVPGHKSHAAATGFVAGAAQKGRRPDRYRVSEISFPVQSARPCGVQSDR